MLMQEILSGYYFKVKVRTEKMERNGPEHRSLWYAFSSDLKKFPLTRATKRHEPEHPKPVQRGSRQVRGNKWNHSIICMNIKARSRIISKSGRTISVLPDTGDRNRDSDSSAVLRQLNKQIKQAQIAEVFHCILGSNIHTLNSSLIHAKSIQHQLKKE